MKVLSLFDGMSCGRIALDRAGIEVTSYHASELDKYTIQVTQANWPETVQLGDVTKWREWDIDWAGIDLLIGGSPCQGFSFAGKQLAFDDPRSKLFFVYVDILNHIKKLNPDVKFMLENVRMKKEYLAIISEQLGVEPVFINSALVSAQNRHRFYWCNWNVEQPEDTGVLLADILEVDPANSWEHNNHIKSMYIHGVRGPQLMDNNKTYSLTATCAAGGKALVSVEKNTYRKLTPIECERLQTVPDNYTNHVSNTQRYKMLGNGWTVDVIAHIFKQGLIKNETKNNTRPTSSRNDCRYF